MTFLFDTNAISDFMDEHPRIDEHLAAIAPGDTVITCAIVRGEILFGIERLPRGRRRDELSAKAHGALSGMECEDVPAAAADHFGRLKAMAEGLGTALDDNDLWIASTALIYGAILVTRDQDFERLGVLRVEDWTR